MNILVIGLGSMGKRRIRLIREMYPEYTIYGVDGREDRCLEVKSLFKIETAASLDAAAQTFFIETAFVCTSPLSHSTIIKKCLEYKWNVFTELNLVSDGYEQNMELAKRNGCTLFLSSTFLYREEIQYIKNYASPRHQWNYIYHIGQYLPDWHPWEKYQDFFIGDKKTNGCREIMAIELPWLVKTFGNVESFQVKSDKMSKLQIDYNDNYMIQLTHANGNKGVLIVDVVSPVAVRHLDLYAENQYLQWKGIPDSLFIYDSDSDGLKKVTLNETEEHKEGYRAFVVENAYKNEIRAFMDVIKGTEALYSFQEDIKVLSLIDSLEGGS